MSEWKEITLGNIAKFNYGKLPIKKLIGKGEYPIYTGYRYFASYPECNCKKGDLIVVARGVGGTGDVKLIEEDCFLTNLSIKIDLNKCEATNTFIFYTFWIDNLLYLDSGSAQSQITINDLSKISIKLPPIPIQESIAEVLSSIDDKIDLLHQQNKTLEALAETLYRHWFVEEADDSWTEVTLENYIEIISGYSYRSVDLNPSNIALVTLKNFERTGGFRIDGFKEYTGKYKKEQIVTKGDLIVAHTDITQEAEVLGNPAIVIDNAKYQTLVISTDLAKVNPTSFLSKEFLYYLLRTDDFKHYCLGCSNGTTVLHLSKKALPNYTFKIPPVDKVKNFTNFASSILIKVQANHNQIISLEGMRDTLLPKLMSGTVRVMN